MNSLLQDMPRTRLIQIWFGIVTLAVVTGITLGASVTGGTGALLFVMCLVPPGLLHLMWNGARSQTVAEILHDADRRR